MNLLNLTAYNLYKESAAMHMLETAALEIGQVFEIQPGFSQETTGICTLTTTHGTLVLKKEIPRLEQLIEGGFLASTKDLVLSLGFSTLSPELTVEQVVLLVFELYPFYEERKDSDKNVQLYSKINGKLYHWLSDDGDRPNELFFAGIVVRIDDGAKDVLYWPVDDPGASALDNARFVLSEKELSAEVLNTIFG